MHVPKAPVPTPGSFPQSAPSHPSLDDGLSFVNANNNDNNHMEESSNNLGGSNLGTALPHSQTPSDDASNEAQPELSPDVSDGDTLLYNNILLYHDLLHLYEFNMSIHDGDIG